MVLVLGGVLLSQDPSVQVPSALEGLTVVFGMGTCGTPPPSPPNRFLTMYFPSLNYFSQRTVLYTRTHNAKTFKVCTLKTESETKHCVLYWISPRPISTCQLHTLLYFHLRPIYLVVFKGSY